VCAGVSLLLLAAYCVARPACTMSAVWERVRNVAQIRASLLCFGMGAGPVAAWMALGSLNRHLAAQGPDENAATFSYLVASFLLCPPVLLLPVCLFADAGCCPKPSFSESVQRELVLRAQHRFLRLNGSSYCLSIQVVGSVHSSPRLPNDL